MRSILLLVCSLFLLSAGVPSFVHAQSASPAIANPGPANPGTAPLYVKHTDFGVDCITCHDEDPPAKPVPTEVCLSCHGSYDDLADKTSDMGANNPHGSHNGPLDCGNCHGVHRPSVNFCAQCHASDLDVP
jgi:fumarate reductase flavoprotein subunit